MKFQLLTTLFLVALLSIAVSAQSERHDLKKESVLQQLAQLQKGSLVVRLSSNHRKITELERLANSPDANEKSKARFKKMLEQTRTETRQEGLDVMKAFANNYNFSKVLFMYDTASVQLKKGVMGGYFLNKDLEVDPSIQLENDNWLLIYFRHESPASFMLLDQEFEAVQHPFPLPKRPVLSKFVRDPFSVENPGDGAIRRPSGGFTLFMSYSRKNQLKFFSVQISNWQRSLVKAKMRF